MNKFKVKKCQYWCSKCDKSFWGNTRSLRSDKFGCTHHVFSKLPIKEGVNYDKFMKYNKPFWHSVHIL